ncbi:MAG: hypothetical protein DLM59_15020 [Pseudonocardiales bacterium]|nr:MAG: hypothetical protein DLM59_15020 [Pseudonocardiales bacterium]
MMRDHLDDFALPSRRHIGAAPEHAISTPAQAAVLRLQREAGNEAVSSLMEGERSPVLDVVGSGSGSALPSTTRAGMEARFGADFSGVRLHTDGAAAASAQSVQAKAYTVGDDVVLGAGVDPSSSAGEKTLAHELTHVLQQRAGDVDGTPAAGGIKVSDPGDRFEQEAEHTADRVMSGEPPAIGVPAGAPAAGVQREGAPEEEEEPLQALRIQREGEDTLEDEAPA